ncbi:MAG: anti-sigma factor [Rhodobacteraceae bacterium]|nr:anti-sigma factor [Paracoccaceae bacterium]
MSDQITYDGGDEDDILAAEYVLGVLDAPERAAADRRLLDDRQFAGRVARWQQDLAPFDAAYAEVTPPPQILGAIQARLFDRPAPHGLFRRLWSGVGFWRGVAAVSLAALALGAVITVYSPPTPGPSLVTTIAANNSDVSFVALYDSARDQLRVRQTSGTGADGDKSYELWVIPVGQKPVSLGVLAAETSKRALPADLAALIRAGATLAVTLEPLGGSPSGDPTGPVLAAGAIQAI